MKDEYFEKKSILKSGIVRGIAILVIMTIIVFFVIKSVVNTHILDLYRDSMVSRTEITASQFEDIISSNITYLSGVSELLGECDSLKSVNAREILGNMEEGSYFSKLYVLYRDGIIMGSTGTEFTADEDSIKSMFSPAIGFGRSRVLAGQNDIILHVPIVEGNIELIGVLDEEYFIKKLTILNDFGVSRFMLLNSETGDVNLDVTTEGDIPSKEHSYFQKMEGAEYKEGFSYADIRSDMLKMQNGFSGYKLAGDTEYHYQSYMATGYENWYVIQVVEENVIRSEAGRIETIILTILCVLVIVYMLILSFILYLNHRKTVENEKMKMQVKVEELANDAKTTFLSNMSHDIRTPLNAIAGLADICEMNADNPDRVKECIGKQKAAAEHLMTLINDVLEMSKIESGKVTFEEAEFKVNIAIHNLVNMVQQRIEEKDQVFSVSINNLTHETIIGDKQRIARAVLNIISNAVKFTGVGGKISIIVDEQPCDKEGYSIFRMTVKDNGIGMSESFIKKIFLPFERMQDSTVSQIEGAGLGMTIAHDLICKMGGSIDVKSELGIGTEVILSIPVKVVDEPNVPKQYEPVFDKLLGKYIITVDNDVSNVEWLDRLVTSFGMRSFATTSGMDAIEKVKELRKNDQDIALMIFGWKMPKMNGLELAFNMREIVGNEIPILLQTAYEFNESENDMRTSGINKVLAEPIFRTDMLEIFYELVNGGSDSDMSFPDFRGKRVLLVEDHKVNAEIIAEYLRYTGIQVETVYDGMQAVERMQTIPDGYYNLILMDIRMPKLDGYEATKQIRAMKSDYTKYIPIIALSANAFAEDRKKSNEVGMNGHLAKPVKCEEIYAELKKWLL